MFKFAISKLQSLFSKYKGIMPAVDQAFVSIASLTISILIVRFVGLENFGIYASLLVISYFGVMLSDSSVSAYIANVGEQEKGLEAEETFKLLLVSVTIALVVALVGCLYINYLSIGEDEFLVVIFAFIAIYLLHEQLRKFYVLKDRFTALLFLDLTTASLQLIVLGFYLFQDNVSLSEILTLMLSTRVLVLTLSLILFKINLKVNSGDFLAFFRRFYADVRFLIPSGFIKYFSKQGFFIAMMALVTLEQFGLVCLVQALFKPSNFMLMAYENYLPKQLKGKSEKKSNKISLNFLMVYMAIVFVSFTFARFGDGIIQSFVFSEYIIDKYLIYCWGMIAFFGGLSLVLRARLRVLYVSKKILNATFLSGLVSLGLLVAANLLGFGYIEIMLCMLGTNILYFSFLLHANFKVKATVVAGN